MRLMLGLPAGLLALASAVVPASAADDSAPPAGFSALFDGKTLDGWKPVNTKDNFFVKDGILVMNRGSGWLATEKTFGDFELRVRYRFITPGTDSGIFIRSGLEGSNWTSHGYQVQNMDNETLGKFFPMGKGVKVQGEHRPNLVKEVKKPPGGEWQDLTIQAVGKHGEVTLNGKQVATTDDLTIADGHIGLQAEGGVLEFQRIDIKPLTP
ncbi:MAG TPA: DUF1080 domain-containing protein [Isosphaeraceae bacterium]|jgi:hypothetical protein|nr:DUF1080 domain-containing protein [Isosphaeraceae bacterium]